MLIHLLIHVNTSVNTCFNCLKHVLTGLLIHVKDWGNLEMSSALISCITVGIHGLLISSILGYRKQKDVRKGFHSQKIAKKGLGLIVDN